MLHIYIGNNYSLVFKCNVCFIGIYTLQLQMYNATYNNRYIFIKL